MATKVLGILGLLIGVTLLGGSLVMMDKTHDEIWGLGFLPGFGLTVICGVTLMNKMHDDIDQKYKNY